MFIKVGTRVINTDNIISIDLEHKIGERFVVAVSYNVQAFDGAVGVPAQDWFEGNDAARLRDWLDSTSLSINLNAVNPDFAVLYLVPANTAPVSNSNDQENDAW